MTTTITEQQLQEFLSKCTVSYEGDSYESKGKMMDPEGNEFIASINYDTEETEVIDEIYIDDQNFFIPTTEQQAIILEEIDRQTAYDREGTKELRNQPISKYDQFGLDTGMFI